MAIDDDQIVEHQQLSHNCKETIYNSIALILVMLQGQSILFYPELLGLFSVAHGQLHLKYQASPGWLSCLPNRKRKLDFH